MTNQNVWGHRGCRGAGSPPENSIRAFEYAIEFGVGGIELDIHLSKDGVPVVFHDSTLDRMTGISGELRTLTSAELQKLELVTVEGGRSKQTIPSLDEVLESVNARRESGPFVVNIELKDWSSAPAVAVIVQRRLAAGWNVGNFLISSFEIACLRDIKTLLPDVPIGALFECMAEDVAKRIEDTAELRPATINIPSTSLTPAVLASIRRAGASTVVWTPAETNPNQLPQIERDKLLQGLRAGEFVMISDFPKELCQMLRPSKAKATATGVLAACLSYGQQEMLFRPNESGLEGIKSPSAYPEIKGFGFDEFELIAEDGEPLTVWERKGALDRPHFLLFHGNRAHWGDTGGGDRQRDRKARLKFIAELASSGAGVMAVTLRGFGKSSAKPSELGFVRDLRAVTEHLRGAGCDHQRLVVAGESLGTWAATQASVYLTEGGAPPALLSLQNPFSCMAEVGERVVSQLPIVRSLHIALSAQSLDRHVLKSHFYTAHLLAKLTADTVIHIATSCKDSLVDPSHSDRLTELCRGQGLRVVRDLFPEALHHTIPPVDFARRLLRLGVESCRLTSETSKLWGGELRAIAPVDPMPYL